MKKVLKQLLDGNDADMTECAKVLDSTYQPENSEKTLPVVENEIRNSMKKFHINKRETVRRFYEYLEENELPDILILLKGTFNRNITSSLIGHPL